VLKVDKKGQECKFINQRNIITFALDNIQLTKAVFDIHHLSFRKIGGLLESE
jgi:hypothetical protein